MTARARRALIGPRLFALAVSATLLLGACASPAEEPKGAGLTVFAAASLRDVFEELEGAWQASHPGSELTVAHDGSNILAAQIREGAPADVFISADLVRPQQLLERGDAHGEVVVFARNRLALVAPVHGTAVHIPSDLATPGVRIVAAGPGVPITTYTELALSQLATSMPDPQGFLDAVSANIVSREDNVRAALAKVELGEGDAVVVYATDALSSDGVREIPLPADVRVSAEYGAVSVSQRPEAAEFVAWLGEADATDILEQAGFEDRAS